LYQLYKALANLTSKFTKIEWNGIRLRKEKKIGNVLTSYVGKLGWLVGHVGTYIIIVEKKG
jgi:hypothetical protein